MLRVWESPRNCLFATEEQPHFTDRVSDAVIFPDHSETGVKTRKFAGTLACAGAAAVLGRVLGVV